MIMHCECVVHEWYFFSDEHQQRAFNIPKEATPGRGAPRYVLTEGMISALSDCRFTAKRMASVLGVSLRTIRRRLRYSTHNLDFIHVGSL